MSIENAISREILDACIRIHRETGPGLLESVYQHLLVTELENRKLQLRSQVAVPIAYGGQRFEVGFRADLIVENRVLVEIKSVENVKPVHKKQVLTYARLSALRLGLLVNFGAPRMLEGFFRVVNGLPDD
ncbi:MAG: GxxExxY protein [Leptospiraceae bacterium]|nr:GxxExxY protein [Leptospiraceae bacterium]MCP5485987.1 GxxExxY protein [Spirochaetales bacterium]